MRIEIVESAEPLEAIKALWLEYWESFQLPPEFQGFEQERQALPGAYSPPKGRLLLAWIDGDPAATIAMRPLTERSCEAKRLYVRPAFRGRGVARALLTELIEQARAAGYTEMFGDTLDSMRSALRLYTQIGFVEIPAYSANPTPDAIFFKLVL